MPIKKNKTKIILISLFLLALALVIFIIYTSQFTSFGYRATAPLRNFVNVGSSVYINKGYKNGMDTAASIANEAKNRVKNYFGEIKSSPTVIICDDEETIKKLGGDHDTSTVVFLKAYSYIVLSPEYLNVDILAHELTHAEVHSRVYNGKLFYEQLMPVWFDEGVALQNDYREQYSGAAWSEATNNGSEITDISAISGFDTFYTGEPKSQRYNYVISKHELGNWISKNGKQALLGLLEKINQGSLFDSVYYNT
ncbi:MAG: hypothetical protein LBV08_03685 [Clostridiales bacterium]|nr:hypothetical protein [Clostridiales bacterium]